MSAFLSAHPPSTQPSIPAVHTAHYIISLTPTPTRLTSKHSFTPIHLLNNGPPTLPSYFQYMVLGMCWEIQGGARVRGAVPTHTDILHTRAFPCGLPFGLPLPPL